MFVFVYAGCRFEGFDVAVYLGKSFWKWVALLQLVANPNNLIHRTCFQVIMWLLPKNMSKDATSWLLKNKVHSTVALVAENLDELATRRCHCICTAWKPRSPCWLLQSFVLLWPVISKANIYYLYICQTILWILVRKMRRFPRNRFMHGVWDSWCYFWTVNSAFSFFTMFLLLLVHFRERRSTWAAWGPKLTYSRVV